ncbi:hypothetical protein [Candidatus Nitrososphaera sp. FF02]|uniref:hypothetical protein n=1 Tax=Candidatus Nitrososphaera sp. FF02 TaxID=3398226 RepID=UPI0039E80293
MAVFFYAGIALVAIGTLFIMVNVGSDIILLNSTFGLGIVFFAMGALLTVIAAPYKKKRSKS